MNQQSTTRPLGSASSAQNLTKPPNYQPPSISAPVHPAPMTAPAAQSQFKQIRKETSQQALPLVCPKKKSNYGERTRMNIYLYIIRMGYLPSQHPLYELLRETRLHSRHKILHPPGFWLLCIGGRRLLCQMVSVIVLFHPFSITLVLDVA